jgi:hybrid cluster-associated redox disulfide protein
LRQRKDASARPVHDTPDVINTHETVSALLANDPRAARILLNHGMHCVGCAIARFETLAEVCAVYGVPVEQLLKELGGPGPEADKESDGHP